MNLTSLAFEVVADAVSKCSKKADKEILYKHIADSLEVPPSSIWFPLKEKRAWSIERWLLVLHALGALSFHGDHITISSSKLKRFGKDFSQIKQL